MSDKEYRAEQIAREAAKRLDEVRAGSSKSELLPCPFCGGEAEILTAESMHGGYLSGIMCNDCRSRGDVYDTEAEAIEAWNTRAETATLYEYGFYLNGKKFVPERTCRMTDRGECSECGAYIVRAWTEVHDFNGDMKRIDLRSHNYCPNCGARVVSE